MRQTNLVLAVLTAAVLAACGGSDGGGSPAPVAKPTFASQVTFGDSLSDVGTYAVGAVAALRGGKYTINGDNTAINPALTGKNWTELMAAQFKLAAPCAAQTGLDGSAANGFSVPVVNYANCYGYAQGGARVTNPVGPANKLTGSALGQLTVPVVTQVANHLAKSSGAFKGNEIVFVMAGGNDALMLLGELSAAATAAGTKAGAAKFASSLATQLAAGATNPATAAAAIGAAMQTEAARAGSTSESLVAVAVGTAAVQPGNAAVASPAVYGPMVVKAQAEAAAAGAAAGAAYGAENGPKLVAVMGDTGLALAAIIKTELIAKGANYVVVNNLPDLGSSPSGKSQPASTQTLINGMVTAFNTALKVGLDGTDSKVVQVDLFTLSNDQVKNPGNYGFTNVTTPACGANALGRTSLVCNATNVIPGDVSHYMWADDVHPTPYASSLIAKAVSEQMALKGWL